MAPQKGCEVATETTAFTTAPSHIRRLQHPTRVSHLNQLPDPRPSTTPSHVGRSPAASYATEPRATHTPLTRTVRITRTRLTYMHSSPTGSGTEALTSILSWGPSREAAHPPPRPLRLDPSTRRNCSPTRPSPPRAARGARAALRATAPRFPPRHRTTAVFTVFWPASSVSS